MQYRYLMDYEISAFCIVGNRNYTFMITEKLPHSIASLVVCICELYAGRRECDVHKHRTQIMSSNSQQKSSMSCSLELNCAIEQLLDRHSASGVGAAKRRQ
jgi:hypothetical protein